MAMRFKVMVLAGGPDREREVSLVSGAQVTAAARAAGHEVVQCDIGPDDLSALDRFEREGFDVLFPILHGSWGEGGGLQRHLDERGLAYVGSRAAAASLCMDKDATKRALAEAGLATPASEVVDVAGGGSPGLAPPLVLKPLREGSSIDLYVCMDGGAVASALASLRGRHERVLAERFVRGREMTVGVLGEGEAARALPPIHIQPATAFYDYQAKYVRDDTRYVFEIDPPGLIGQLQQSAAAAHAALGCRHLSRVDFMVDEDDRAWVLEVNTLPGFTTHSLLPMAAARAGLAMPGLVTQLLTWAMAGVPASR